LSQQNSAEDALYQALALAGKAGAEREQDVEPEHGIHLHDMQATA
jgi:hypothetical protein